MILRWRIECFYGFALLVTASLSGCSLTDKHYGGASNRLSARATIKSWRRKAQEQLLNRLQPYPENLLTPPQIIEKRGYPVEIHQVTTDDGYILDLHRIPAKSSSGPKQVVFLQHGVAESSATWLVNPSSRSLPLLLADQSYDVWLGNVRGNRYSRRHVTLNPKKADFWKFSWDEIGNYDLPAIINYILKETGQPKMSYIGHSLGCATFFIAMLKHPELNDKIDTMVALAPVSSFAHFTSPIFRLLAPFGKTLEKFFRLIGTWGWLDGEGFGEIFFRAVCGYTYKQAKFCRDLIIFVTGPNPNNLDPAIALLAISNVFRGTSVPVIAQFAQNFQAGDVFQAYDYGKIGNEKRYGSKKPMEYNLKKVTAPVYVFSAGKDRIVSPLDVDWLETQLGNLKGSIRIPYYDHIDFIWGTDVKEIVYDQVMALLPPP
ncbi:gastric triacylglycerol lipase-like [Daphnia pulex]|uniref:gastric triacylglycerol lipase-like n=1 Tax=Daphnia pulex TaxID=6669 RepID=UPI001EDF7081|nr:gastric triacylglycerol lipase-like [Daphnia pulex]XP_046448188.1 gastric triacylglycerol lipase-like [Daphnia pulex]XP_046448189.1 gastric triacylglycerol lipase-like [Daphnia pulex]XP_046448191.1 gastric triacylglycerol lipase-like [Daphnia pulex]XP_046448192.1 gastric triacylglycerol lipase-like [Daphnia pulex]